MGRWPAVLEVLSQLAMATVACHQCVCPWTQCCPIPTMCVYSIIVTECELWNVVELLLTHLVMTMALPTNQRRLCQRACI